MSDRPRVLLLGDEKRYTKPIIALHVNPTLAKAPKVNYTYTMPNIFITDLDHTFLRTDLSVSDFTRHAWNP